MSEKGLVSDKRVLMLWQLQFLSFPEPDIFLLHKCRKHLKSKLVKRWF
jgi:hypothetical protein